MELDVRMNKSPNMIIDDLLKNSGSWLSMGNDTGIVISSRVRLARNIREFAFPGRADKQECIRLCDRLREVCGNAQTLADPLFLDMNVLSPVDREVLKERHLISNELAGKGPGSGVVFTGDEQIAVMINEEDHIRLQAIRPGMDLQAAWETVNAVDSELESHLDYAFSPRLGYLTACPSNVGTGLRASVMMHLSALKLLGEVDSVIKGLDKIGLAVRGLLGEGTEAYGNMFQISNQTTLGETENAMIGRLVQVVNELIRHEQNARARLMDGKKTYVFDQIGRAFGVLVHACVLSSEEALDLLSALRLGVEFNIIRNLPLVRINEIMILTQPGHLQRISGNVLSPQERDEARARIVKEKLADVELMSQTI